MTDDTNRRERDSEEARMLGSAALIGAVIGAGLGLLLSQAFEREPTISDAMRVARRKGGRALRKRRATAVEAGSDALQRAGGALGHYAEQAREMFEDAVAREIKDLRRAARRQRRRIGL